MKAILAKWTAVAVGVVVLAGAAAMMNGQSSPTGDGNRPLPRRPRAAATSSRPAASRPAMAASRPAGARAKAPKPADGPAGLANAALSKNGGRISVQLGKGAGSDKTTKPEEVIDGNPHSRMVVWGEPVTYRIELIDKLPVAEIAVVDDDYATEKAPKDIEVKLSDGTVLTKTLEVLRPTKNDRARQVLKVDKTIEWIEVKVLSNQQGTLPEGRSGVNYGGIGEIEVMTSADLSAYLSVKSYNPQTPAYVEGGSPRSDYSAVKTTLPGKIALGQHPGIYLTRDEIVQMREKIKADPRGQAMLDRLLTNCAALLEKPVVLPDPNVPAQLRDRGDAQAKAHGALSRAAGSLAWAYQLTDDEKYAAKAREILVGYAKLYPNDYKEHKGVNGSDTSKVMAQRLSEAMWVLPLIQAYDMIYNATCMSDADRKLIEKDLVREAITFINGKKDAAAEAAAKTKANPDWRTADPAAPKGKGAVGNWMNFYNAAYIQGGVVLGDPDWIDIGCANTKYMIANGIGDDGMWKEGAIGYQLFARHALVACCEALARKGHDLYGFQTCRLKNLFDSPFKYAYPDGTAPGIHDSGRVNVGGSWEAMAYDFGYLRYGDVNYGKIVNECMRQLHQSEGCYFPTVIYEKVPQQELAGLGSLVFADLGYAILRGKDSGGPTFLLMDYGPHGGPHGHPDKLNLVLYADGDELAGEPQPYRYEDPRHGEWTVPTIAHWTLAVDGASQSPTTGKLLCFYDGGAVKAMRGQSDGAYPGVVLDRTAVQMPGYFVDLFRAEAAAERTFDYPLCFRGEVDALQGVQTKDLKPLGDATQRGYKHILITQPKETSADWTGTWSRAASTAADANSEAGDERRVHPANEVKATVLGAPGTTVYAGVTPGERQQVLLRRKGKEATFATVINPFKGTSTVKAVEPIKVEGPVPACGVKVTRSPSPTGRGQGEGGGTDLIVVRYDPQTGGKPAAASTFAGAGSAAACSTDALITVIRLDAAGKVIEMGMIGGTSASAGETKLALDAPGIVFKK